MKYLLSTLYRYPTYYGIDYENDGVTEVRGEMIQEDGSINESIARYISRETAEDFPRTELREGDLVMTVRGTLGKIGLVTSDLAGSNITANVMRLEPKRKEIRSEFLMHLLKSHYFEQMLELESDATTIKTITVPSLVNIALPVPPLKEQDKIISQIAERTAELDEVIEREGSLISALQELRTSLISEVVTGKIDVRDEVPEQEKVAA